MNQLNYKTFLENINTNITRVACMGKISKDDVEAYFRARPFVFFPKCLPDKMDYSKGKELILDLPFKECFFEIYGHTISNAGTFSGSDYHRLGINDLVGANIDVDICGIFVQEIRPGKYDFTNLFRTSSVHEGLNKVLFFLNKNNGNEASKSYVKTFLDVLTKENRGLIKYNHYEKIKFNGEKFQTRIKDVICVGRKQDQKEESRAFNIKIDWTHRWEVSGHWRKISGIGKDREGNYCIEGFTWIIEHERGPEDKVLIKKTRIINNYKQESEKII